MILHFISFHFISFTHFSKLSFPKLKEASSFFIFVYSLVWWIVLPNINSIHGLQKPKEREACEKHEYLKLYTWENSVSRISVMQTWSTNMGFLNFILQPLEGSTIPTVGSGLYKPKQPGLVDHYILPFLVFFFQLFFKKSI